MVVADTAGPDRAFGEQPDDLTDVVHPVRTPPPGTSRSARLALRARETAGRFGWGVADQAVSSLTNSAVSIYVARELGAVQFGAFSLAYVTYSFALNASRGLATDPLTVRFSVAELPTWRRAVASSTGTALVVGFVAAVCALGTAAGLAGTASRAFLALGLTLPGLMLQDSWRYAFFALGRGSQAFLNDTIWAVAMLPALVALKLTHHSDVFTFVLAWGLAANIAAAMGPLQARVAVRPSEVWSWISEHRDLGPRYLAENTANSGGGQLRTYGIGLFLGLAALGYVQTASLLMGPFFAILMGLLLVTVPEAARVLHRSPQHLRKFCVLLGGGLALTALAWGGVLLLLLPRGLGHWMLGAIWRPTYPLVLPVTLWFVGMAAAVGASAGLRALGASRRSLFAQIVMSIGYVVSSLVGALLWGAMGAVVCAAIAVLPGTVLWWWQLHAAIREAGIASAGDPEPAAPPVQLAEANGQREGPVQPERLAQTQLSSSLAAAAPLDGPASPPLRSVPPTRPVPSFTPTTWMVVIASDWTYYDRMQITRALSGSALAFPGYRTERQVPLAGKQMRIGRGSAARGLKPEIDLSGPPADPGVSRLHAVLIPVPDGTWAVLDPGSANGTLLNGRKITVGDLTPLHDGDRINLGAWTVITVYHR
jgi:O-antigen/teichoic acid export membrane protein